ncbi:hypothetical protein JJQ97_07830 [Pseudomonas syringae]|uniref:hypothetical protein n=1 Tax=Pseudomonas syringae TaxID=317 RepID=UPI0019177457|nr:hypothetical protein [Pseudomonas syringae]QQQ52119.1 hypothetical protein JJQ97_07830 [Pseudomonas syringae]
MPDSHAQMFQCFAERRRLIFGVRVSSAGMAGLWAEGQLLCEIDGLAGFSQPGLPALPDGLPSTPSTAPAAQLSDSHLRQLLSRGDLLAMGGERSGVQYLQTLGVGQQILSLQARREGPERWSLWHGSEPLVLSAEPDEPAAVPARYELLLLAPLLDYGGPTYADTQAWNAAYRRRLGESPEPFDPACAEMAGRIEMILAALDDDAAGIVPLDHDVRPRPGGLKVDDFPAMMFLPHPIGEFPALCPVHDRGELYRLLYAVHEAGIALDIDPGWRDLIN